MHGYRHIAQPGVGVEQNVEVELALVSVSALYIGSISASLTACLLHGYGRAGTQNDRLS